MPTDIVLGSVPGFRRRFFHLQQAFLPQRGDRGGFSCITPENRSFNLKSGYLFLSLLSSVETYGSNSQKSTKIYSAFNLVSCKENYTSNRKSKYEVATVGDSHDC